MTQRFQQLMRRYMLQHAHPMKFTAEVLGLLWSIYLLWNHHWIVAIVVSCVSFGASTVILWRANERVERFAQTPTGKVMLVYASPVAFCFYNLSAVPLVYGLWTHRPFYILIAISILLAPHLWRWSSTAR